MRKFLNVLLVMILLSVSFGEVVNAVALTDDNNARLWGDVHVIVNGVSHLPSEPLFDQNSAKEGEIKQMTVDSKYDWQYSQYGDGEISLSIPQSKAGKTDLEITFIKAGNVSIVFERLDGGDKETFTLNIGKGELVFGKVAIEYVDEAGNLLETSEQLEGKVGSGYEVAPKTISGYAFKELSAQSAPSSGIFSKEIQVVTFVYTVLPEVSVSTVSVDYLNENGEKLTETTFLHGKIGSSYMTTQKEFRGFVFKEVSAEESPATGEFKSSAQKVVYLYVKLPSFDISSISVQHLDESGNQLLEQEILHGMVSQSYVTTAKTIPGYTFKEMAMDSAPAEGEFKSAFQEVVYVYTKLPDVDVSSVSIEHVDENGQALVGKDILHGKVGSRYVSGQKRIEGYVFKELAKISAPAEGDFKPTPQEVIYIYAKLPNIEVSSVSIEHVDEKGRALASKEILHGKVGTRYVSNRKRIEGYAFKGLAKTSAPAESEFKSAPQEVIYVYTKLPEVNVSSVSIEHVDEKGRALANKEIIHGKIGSNYRTERNNFIGYTFKELAKTSAPAEGQFQVAPQEVVYVYAKLPNVEVSSVSIEHVDEKGQALVSKEILHGKVGAHYTSSAQRIEGYTFKELAKTSAPAEGQFQVGPQEVVYVYAKNQLLVDKPKATNDRKHQNIPATGEKQNSMSSFLGSLVVLLIFCYYYYEKRKEPS